MWTGLPEGHWEDERSEKIEAAPRHPAASLACPLHQCLSLDCCTIFLWDHPTIQGEHRATFQSLTLFARRSFGHLLASYRSAEGDVVFRVYEGFKIDSWECYCLLPAPEG